MRYLKNTQTGVVFFWTEILARKKYMVEVSRDEMLATEGRTASIPLQPTPEPTPEPEVPAETAVVDLDAMDKKQLDEYAERELGLKLDRRKPIAVLIETIKQHLNGAVE